MAVSAAAHRSDCPTSLKPPQLSHPHPGVSVHRGFHIPFAPRILTGRVLHRFDVVACLRGLARRRGLRRQALEFSDPRRLMGAQLSAGADLSSELIAGKYTRKTLTPLGAPLCNAGRNDTVWNHRISAEFTESAHCIALPHVSPW